MGAAKRVASRDLFDTGANDVGEGSVLPRRSELMSNSGLFPQQLLQLKDVPQKLYALGSVQLLNQPAIAIVGARKATAYGLECAQHFARKAATWGITVVSGGAIGCDMAAHRGALDAGGHTVVVLGSGADVVYPLRARGLFKEVLAAEGTLLSEAPWGSPPLSWAFSRRNRIIAALAQATLIVEAGLPSGTFQTADHTLALGNDVLVVPGPIFSKEFKGSNRLMAQGATPIIDGEGFEDALSQIFGPKRNRMDEAKALDCVEASDCARVSDRAEASTCKDESGRGPTPDNDSAQDGDTATPSGDNQEVDRTGFTPGELKLYYLTQRLLTDLRANPMSVDALSQAYKKDTVELIRIISRMEIDGQLIRLRDGRYMAKPE